MACHSEPNDKKRLKSALNNICLSCAQIFKVIIFNVLRSS